MSLKLPKYYNVLASEKKKEWDNIKYIFDNALNEYSIVGTSNPNISDFHLINSKIKPLFLMLGKFRKMETVLLFVY